jgi:hypothetical protein
MRRSTLVLLTTIFSLLAIPAPALEIAPDAYKLVQWRPGPDVYMPIPPPPRPDYYREWRNWGGYQVQPRYPRFAPSGPTGRCYYNVYRRLVCD